MCRTSSPACAPAPNSRTCVDGRVDKVYEGTEALTADDIAETVYWMAALPAHFNVNAIEIMPVCQSFTATSVTRNLA